jgi:hypothetical protein
MKVFSFSDMTNGWFVGDFSPTSFKTSDCEVATKSYKKGAKEESHFHKIATEITLIYSGSVIMFDQRFDAGSIVVVEPYDETSFEAIEDTLTIVVKVPGALNDKYLSKG